MKEILSKITTKGDNGCLVQNMPLKYNDKRYPVCQARRVVYEALTNKSTDPCKEIVYLTCENRSCLNIEHMEVITHYENNRRLKEKRIREYKEAEKLRLQKQSWGIYQCKHCGKQYEWNGPNLDGYGSEVCSVECLLQLRNNLWVGYNSRDCLTPKNFPSMSVIYKGMEYNRRHAAIAIKEEMDLIEDIEKIKDIADYYVCAKTGNYLCFNPHHLIRVDEKTKYILNTENEELRANVLKKMKYKLENALAENFVQDGDNEEFNKLKKKYEELKMMDRANQ